MRAIKGQYNYAQRRQCWGVWQWKSETSATFIMNFATKEEAREYVWKMNGWGTSKRR